MRPLIIIGLIATLAVLALLRFDRDRDPPPAVTGYALLVAEASGAAAEAERLVALHSGSWLAWQRLAEARLAQARLHADYPTFAAAEAALERAFAIAAPGAGPFLTRAALNATLHRVDRVDADLAAVERTLLLSDRERAAVARLRAETALQCGRHAEAEAGYRAVLALRADAGACIGLAVLAAKTGDQDAARGWLDRADQATSPEDGRELAWVRLQRGLFHLDHGRLDQAAAAYAEAETLCPGWWLVREHAAEILARRGQHTQARARYQALVAETGNPEFMDALSGVCADLGDATAAVQWRQRARSAWQGLLERFPEAAAGHALSHFLDSGDQPSSTLALAERNAALRPGGDALTALAAAQLAAGQTVDARTAIAQALAIGWDTAELHAVFARVLAAEGDQAGAGLARARARSIDPTIHP